jgi:alpha-beta hydrolase superfamily lysophospholipase
MRTWMAKTLKRVAALIAVIAITLLAIRAYDSQRGRPLKPWHIYAPHELTVKELDQDSWAEYLKVENAIFDDVRSNVTQKLKPEERIPINRYFDGSPMYPGHFAKDWNRSFVMEPDGPVIGAAVFLHGLTDSPYSLRHIARRYSEHGYVSIAIRLPGHGTVPGALTDVKWEEWLAATRLAVREARRRIGQSAPLHLIGYSNGGALALMYALEAIDDKRLTTPDRIVLISPMIGVTRFARFAGLAGLPAIFPAFAKAAWLSVIPEFNPFKYNSFPVNAARQSYLLTSALQQKIAAHARANQLAGLPPIITFQSAIDFTVSARAIISALYRLLPDNGSELVLFDLNRNAKLGPLLSSPSETVITRLLPDPPQRYRSTIITNANPDTNEVVERVTEVGALADRSRSLGMSYPVDVFSLSHVALPFPVSDSLYGLQPDPNEDFGIRLGALTARGERGALIVNLESLLRIKSNPFFPYLMGRIEEFIE